MTMLSALENSELDAKIVKLERGRAPAFSDEDLAVRFCEEHSDDLRYVATQRKWYFWNGVKWALDETVRAFNEVRKFCRREANRCANSNQAQKIASASTIAAVERLSRADRRQAATLEQFDRDPLLLNTLGGIVDLKTGISRPHSPNDYQTRVTTAASGGQCDLWLAFLAEVTGGDIELIAYLKRVAGYCLTGSTAEQALFFVYGTGANGKSVFINTLSWILGEYHRTAAIETFTATTTERHPTDLAALRGARLVTAIETEEGRQWAESRIKSLTGGDKIAARFMRQDFFEFSPQFKLIIAGNHKPSLRCVDEAIRRRLNLIPFKITIPTRQRDPQLGEKLKAQAPGILQWMIDGCLEWQSIGLCPPAAVTAATLDYLEAEDPLSAWLQDCCSLDPHARASSAELFASWSEWARSAGEPASSHRKFSQKLEDRGFFKYRTGKERGFIGLYVTPQNLSLGYGGRD